ncbi:MULTISPECIES: acyl-CoA dehydrogenase family protein [Bradyrhizobium]|uniref:acyl-CoA dehydrogenase family protein n=1 Tax=Bradyrhizobium TaxID=374 RepID=UPI00155E987F|nr:MULTISPECIES: acyl-CoA dehydrogenase family protein [Bradyrhizobium]MDD1520721.1 DNA alkylation response protein [Bradyrhizobium sp. WBAH30]MDD1545772.1 DNA alkylation response protein [Bradyrhizobium sp. WBAH41]MDD1558967.1 DNA alkylation response protein [Bradyrhizobium sp. WBAH23]MDD1566383.1 DNA alkylation response protein [Bradyrhizobium sp. WBAH33]MDD1591976.1 DNA alkylation response protein [Bradyrhizobium sp. WBAH42]
MTVHAGLARREASSGRSKALAPTCRGLNYFVIDQSVRDLLPLYMNAPLLAHLEPHLQELGMLAGSTLYDLSDQAERHQPVLHSRDGYGRDEEWVEYHPAYRDMERIAFGQFGMHAMCNRGGVLGWPSAMPPIAKYVFHYLFAQAEFGLLCPVNLTDSSSELVRRFGSEELHERYLARMWSQDPATLLKCAQFMTEKAGGSDVGAAELTAVRDGAQWKLYGEKWFCSNADAELAVLLARPEGAPVGGRGLGLFLMPKTLPDGSRNAYRIVRLKDKLGSRTMASGEIVFDGAVAYQLGELDQGLKHMLVMVNSSRVSHLARAAGMMRRCLNEALQASCHRNAFGRAVVDHPLMRRQLLKLMVPTEQALSALLYSATAPEKVLRLLTPVVKYRACRDNVTVATGAMEARGGNGYIEDWPNARLVRDAHLGLIWEGTSNINALDAVQRAVGKVGAQAALRDDLASRLAEMQGVPGQFRTRLEGAINSAMRFAEEVAASPENERFCRAAAGKLYHAVTAALFIQEGLRLGATGGDARRLLLARFVLEHRLQEPNTLNLESQRWEDEAIDLLLDDAPVQLSRAAALLVR